MYQLLTSVPSSPCANLFVFLDHVRRLFSNSEFLAYILGKLSNWRLPEVLDDNINAQEGNEAYIVDQHH
ncbi:hypothetical protein ACH3XW_4760 [Acanthocheilonema viteae]